MRELAQADPAEAELAIDGARASAPVAARVGPRCVLGLPLLLDDERLLGHLPFPSLCGEREPERAEKCTAGLVRLRRRGDRDIESADPRNLVVVDLRKDNLLADPDGVVAAAVERARVEPAKVADARQSDRRETVEELVHPSAAQRHARTDRHPLAELEACDRLRRATDLGALAGDRRQLVDGRVQRLRVGLGLADAHVQRHLRDPGDVHDRGDPELLLQARPDLLLVALLEARHVRLRRRGARHQRSSSWPQPSRLQTRTWTISPFTSRSAMPTRVGLPQTGQTTMTLETGTGAGLSRIPPGTICVPPIREESRIGRGLVCRFATFRFSTMTRRSDGRASMTRPRLPRSLPVSICTVSPFFTFIF